MGDPTTDNYVVTGGFFDSPTHPLRADGFDASEDGTGRGTPLVPVGFMPARTFGKDGEVDSRYAPRNVCDALHTASGGGNKAPLIVPTAAHMTGIGFWRDGLGTLRAREQDSHENLIAYRTNAAGQIDPQGDRSASLTSNTDQCTQFIAFSCKDSGADSGEIAPTLRSMNYAQSHANAGRQIAIAIQERALCENPLAGPDGVGVRTDGLAYTVEARTVPQAVMTLALRGRDGAPNLEIREDGTSNAILTPNGGRGGVGVGAIAIGWSEELTAHENCAGTVQRGGDGGRHEGVMTPAMQVRRLTPTECERLQKFPDGYTKIGEKTADGPRYKALGNSMAVCCMEWIGRRIQLVDIFS